MTADIESESARLDPTLPTVEKPIQYEGNNQPKKGLHPAFFIMLVKQFTRKIPRYGLKADD